MGGIRPDVGPQVALAALLLCVPCAAAAQGPAAGPSAVPPRPASGADRAQREADRARAVEEGAEAAARRPITVRVDVSIGGFAPGDVNGYLRDEYDDKLSGAVLVGSEGFSEVVLLLGLGASVLYKPAPWVAVRPNARWLLAPKVIDVQIGGAADSRETEAYLLHAIAPGVAVEATVNPWSRFQVYVTGGAAYYLGWFEEYSASGVGFEGGVGAHIPFGAKRRIGLSVALIGQIASLPVSDPDVVAGRHVEELDFSSVSLRIGPTFGL